VGFKVSFILDGVSERYTINDFNMTQHCGGVRCIAERVFDLGCEATKKAVKDLMQKRGRGEMEISRSDFNGSFCEALSNM
jgi:hypothetical protein